jgi:acyl carrier protein
VTHDPVRDAFSAIGKTLPGSLDNCLYKSGFIDSFDLMQIVLEIELRTGTRIDLAQLMAGEVTIDRLRTLVNC